MDSCTVSVDGGGLSGADHKNGGFVAVVVAAGPAELESEAPQKQLLHLRFEALAEYVVNHGIVHRGALGKHARQEADLWWDAAAVFEDGPQTYQAIWSPAAQEADTYQNSNLEWSRRKDPVRILLTTILSIFPGRRRSKSHTVNSLRWSLTTTGIWLLLFIAFL